MGRVWECSTEQTYQLIIKITKFILCCEIQYNSLAKHLSYIQVVPKRLCMYKCIFWGEKVGIKDGESEGKPCQLENAIKPLTGDA